MSVAVVLERTGTLADGKYQVQAELWGALLSFVPLVSFSFS